MFKKIKYFFLLVAVMLFSFTSGVLAEGTQQNEIYNRQYEGSGAADLQSSLPHETSELLGDLGFDLSNPDAIFKMEGKPFFSLLYDWFVNGITLPLKTSLSVIGVLLIFASFEGIVEKSPSNGMTVFVCFVSILIATAPVYSLMESVKTAIQTLSNFMFCLVPVYAGVMLSSGNGVAAGGFSTLLLGAAETVSYLISYFFVPTAGAVMCLGICGGISPVAGVLRISEWIKKTANWVMGIATTLFLGVLSIQNSVATATDGLGIRTSKVMLSTAIPIMGPAIAETVNTARGCLNLLRSGVGIYAVVAIFIIAAPIIIQLVLWRISLWITSAVAEIFGMKQVEGLLKSVDFCISVLLSSVCFTALLFIIALALSQVRSG